MARNPYVSLTESVTDASFTSGNEVTLLQNGDEIFPAMLEAIRSATSSVEFLSYVFWRSQIANEFAEALCERAKAGVQVRLLIDAVGGATMNSRHIWRLERAGVKLGWFRPGGMRHLRRFNNRTHRKILLVDGRLGFAGGVGIADAWTGSAQDEHHWRETHCCISGPACLDLRAGFAENWLEATGEVLQKVRTIPQGPTLPQGATLPTGRTFTDVAVHTTISTANTRPTRIEQLFFAVFAAARHRLWITSAYFVPNRALLASLTGAARRGVDVRILTGGRHTDHYITLLAGRASYHELLEAGVRLYEYETTMHHAKIITVDEVWATIGSANLDARSLILNDELNVSFVEAKIVNALDRQFLDDLKQARHITPEEWSGRNWTSRLSEYGSSLFRHQL